MSSTSYETVVIKGTFFKMSGWYLFYMPISVPYSKIHDTAKSFGLMPKEQIAILEKGKSFGKGWIAIEIEETSLKDESIFRLNAEFKSYLHTGAYKKLGNAYKKIMRDYPKATEFFNLYLNSPMEVPEDKLKTMVLFR